MKTKAWEYPADRKRRRRKLAGWLMVFLLGCAGMCYDALYARLGLPGWAELFDVLQIAGAGPATLLQDHATQVHFIDVGQGDAVLLEQSDHFALIDAGSDAYGPQLLGYLEQIGVQELELLVMTHPDRDHIGGMDEVLQQFPVEELWIPNLDNTDAEDPLYLPHVLTTATGQGTEIVIPVPGQLFALGEGMITLLSDGVETDGWNDISLCLRFDVGAFSFLSTGDSEKPAEARLLETGLPLQADVFKAGHHGSSTSNTQELLDAVQPQIVVASCGLDNPYGHPHNSVRQRLAAAGIPLYRTDRHGNVVIVPDADGAPQAYTEKKLA